jgi:hypothetical protein
MEIVLAFIIAFGVLVVGDDVKDVAKEGLTSASAWLDKEIGDDLLGIEDPNQKYRWGNATVDQYGNLKE